MPDFSVDGKLKLEEIESAIKMQETRGFVFTNIGKGEHTRNIVSFDEIPLGTLPKAFTLQPSTVTPALFRALLDQPVEIFADGDNLEVMAWRRL